MSIADKDGKRITPMGRLNLSREQLLRLRDLTIVKLSVSGLSHRAIAAIVNVDHRTIGRRIKGVPPHVRRRIASQALDPLTGI